LKISVNLRARAQTITQDSFLRAVPVSSFGL
jgi:hypothetical protein